MYKLDHRECLGGSLLVVSGLIIMVLSQQY
jgi:hypothetical protein